MNRTWIGGSGMDHHPRRRERLAQQLHGEGLDALLVTSTVNVTYLTGFTGDSSALILTPSRAVLVSDPRYVGQIADECPGLETHIRTPQVKPHEAFAQALTKLGARSVGCESAALTLAEAEALRAAAPAIDWKPAADRVEKLRMVKDEVEIAAIREAIAIAERAFAVFYNLLSPEDDEKELADALEGNIRRCGGLTSSFPPIVAVGARAALPHCPPTARRVRESDQLLVDWGATGPSGYRSDLTRVLPTHRKGAFLSERLAQVHAVVLAAQQAAIRAVRPGAIAKDIDAAARAVIADAGHGEHFGHGLGHGIGLQIHEGPSVRPLSETRIEAGMVFTVEPGVYLPGWGGVRIEDDVLVTPDGCEVLTRVPRELGALAVFAT
jgi:Xaa-Pro aminopeptidase